MAAERRVKALVLFSGGLDSILALRLVLEQGVDAQILGFHSLFHESHGTLASFRAHIEESGAALGVPAAVVDHNEALLRAVRSPCHGYGKNANPCIDCRAAMLRTARERMERIGASFLVTGEVLGQRPMSQRRRAMEIIERDAGVRGLVLRPLSAGILPETLPEKNGWIDRSRLLSIRGRSRRPQMELSERLGVKNAPGSGGGCLLTYPEFARKVLDCVEKGDLGEHHARLLRHGRHFRLPSGAKVVVGRDEEDNTWIEGHAAPGDVLLVPEDLPGPTALLLGGGSREDLELAGSLCGRYMKVDPGEGVRFRLAGPEAAEGDEISSPAMDPGESAMLRLGS